MALVEVQVKWSVILMDRLGPDIFSTLRMKGHVRAHLKVPSWSLVWNTLLTKTLPMFLSRLNEINGGCEKIMLASGSFWSNLKLFRMMDFTAWWWRWNVSVNEIVSLFSFSDVCGDGPLEQQKQDSHGCRRSRTFPLRKNQSHHYKDDEV